MDKLKVEIRNSKYIYTMGVAEELSQVLSSTQCDETWILFAFVLKFTMQHKMNELQYCLMLLSTSIKKSEEFTQEDKLFLKSQFVFLKKFKQKMICQIAMINGIMFIAFWLFAFLFMEKILEIPIIMSVFVILLINTFIMYQRILKRSMDADIMRLKNNIEDKELYQYIQECQQ